jgi:N utilization substance protein A
VREVLVDDDGKQATVVVPDDQLSLAIGREGQNARLAARLTGWRIDIRSETEFATDEPESGYAQEEASGRCAAILGNGRRCPNAALSGSRYCGLESHQALEGTGSDYVAGPPPEEPLPEGDEFVEGEELAEVEESAEPAGLESGQAVPADLEPAPEAAAPEGDLDAGEPGEDPGHAEAPGTPAPAEEPAS